MAIISCLYTTTVVRIVNYVKRAGQGWEKNGFGCAGSRKVRDVL